MNETLAGKRPLDNDLKIVKRIAGSIKRNVNLAEFDDMYQDGCIGLLNAYTSWDKEHGASFETYAGIRIRGEIFDGLRKLQWQPRSYSVGKRKIAEAKRKVESRLLRKASPREIAEEMRIPIGEYYKLTAGHYKQFVSFESSSDENGFTSVSIELEGATPGVETQMLIQEDAFVVKKAMEKVSGKRKLVLDMYVEDELTEATIGVIMGVTESRVCQILNEAIEKLKIEVEFIKNADLRAMFQQLEEKFS